MKNITLPLAEAMEQFFLLLETPQGPPRILNLHQLKA